MRHVADRGAAQYPGFSNDLLDGFRHLAHDLEKKCTDFLSGSGDDFRSAVAKARETDRLTGFQKLSVK